MWKVMLLLGTLDAQAEEPARAGAAEASSDVTLQLDLLELEGMQPDPTAAMLSSLLVGFGAGPFYARQREHGFAHLGLQGGGLLLSGLGYAVYSEGEPQLGNLLAVTGLTLFAGSRAVEIVTAPHLAHRTVREDIAAFRGR